MEKINIADKQDTAEKVAALQGIPANKKIMAAEFNAVKNKVNEIVDEVNTGLVGPQGEQGEPGMSTYELWLSLGNEGTVQDFINAISSGEYVDAPGYDLNLV